MTKALIVGGGIAGLSTAVALSEQGFDVDLIDREHQMRALGSGITLIAPAMRALDRLGVLESCIENGYGTSEMAIYDPAGNQIGLMPLASPMGPEFPGLMGMMRPTLHRILLERAEEMGVAIRTGLSPIAIADHQNGTSVTFDHAPSSHYDLVVGADGLRSSLRGLRFGNHEPVFRNQFCFRAVLPRPEAVTSEIAFAGYGTAHVGLTPTGADSMYLYCCVPASAPARPDANEVPSLIRNHLAPFGGLIAELRDLIVDPGQTNCALLETIVVPQPWHNGHTVLVGDAAHATTPHLAAGAAMALEDAIVLADEISSGDSIVDGLQRYAKRRFDRCKYVVDTSVQLSYWQTHPDEGGADQERLRFEAFGVLSNPC